MSKITQTGRILGESPYAAIKSGTQKLIKRAPELTRNGEVKVQE